MAKRRDRSDRDLAGVGPEPGSTRRLVPLHELSGYDIAEGEPDIRGWDVRTVNGRELGEVDDLLVDPDRGEVVMLEVELRDGGVHTEVPIRSVQLDRERKLVLLDSGDLEEGLRRERLDHLTDDERGRLTEDERGRLTEDERERLRREYRGTLREVKSDEGLRDDRATADEVVIERRPVIEEVVVRRRIVDEE